MFPCLSCPAPHPEPALGPEPTPRLEATPPPRSRPTFAPDLTPVYVTSLKAIPSYWREICVDDGWTWVDYPYCRCIANDEMPF